MEKRSDGKGRKEDLKKKAAPIKPKPEPKPEPKEPKPKKEKAPAVKKAAPAPKEPPKEFWQEEWFPDLVDKVAALETKWEKLNREPDLKALSREAAMVFPIGWEVKGLSAGPWRLEFKRKAEKTVFTLKIEKGKWDLFEL